MLNKLRAIRQGQDLPLIGLSVKAGVSTATLTAIEKWNYTPSAQVRERIANVLQVHISDIWPEQNEPQSIPYEEASNAGGS